MINAFKIYFSPYHIQCGIAIINTKTNDKRKIEKRSWDNTSNLQTKYDTMVETRKTPIIEKFRKGKTVAWVPPIPYRMSQAGPASPDHGLTLSNQFATKPGGIDNSKFQ